MEYRTVIYRNLCSNPALSYDFERYLFNEPEHLVSQKHDEYYTFHLLQLSTNSIVARFSCFVKDSNAISPCRATFGGIEAAPHLSEVVLLDFILKIVNWAKQHPVQAIRINWYSAAYEPSVYLVLKSALMQVGFNIQVTEINQHLALSSLSNVSVAFAPNQVRRLKKCHQKGYQFRELPIDFLTDYFVLLTKARSRKNIPLSLSLTEIEELFKKFPKNFFLFGILDAQILIAACVGVKVNERILYYFLPADHTNYLTDSPSVMLIEQLGEWAKNQTFELLDLGISSVNGLINQGLYQFKQKLGGIETEKVVFLKHF